VGGIFRQNKNESQREEESHIKDKGLGLEGPRKANLRASGMGRKKQKRDSHTRRSKNQVIFRKIREYFFSGEDHAGGVEQTFRLISKKK